MPTLIQRLMKATKLPKEVIINRILSDSKLKGLYSSLDAELPTLLVQYFISQMPYPREIVDLLELERIRTERELDDFGTMPEEFEGGEGVGWSVVASDGESEVELPANETESLASQTSNAINSGCQTITHLNEKLLSGILEEEYF